MKTMIAMILMTLAAALPAPAQVASFGMNVSFGTFYSGLSAYGEWVLVDQDVYAWRPTGVTVGWRPYFSGRWAWTDDGWYWLSEEPWAWATYHYGRWYYDDYYGWMWIPGYEWAPAWVEWRYGGDCVGWAPLGPYALFSMNFGIYYSRPWRTPYHYWAFVPYDYMTSDRCRDHIYRSEYNQRYFGRTRGGGSVGYENGRIISRGVDHGYVEQRTGGRIDKADLVETRDMGSSRVTRSGDRERIQVYRPNLEDRSARSGDARPDKVRSGERTVSLDTRNIEGRVRNDQQGRDTERATQYLQQNRPSEAQRTPGQERRQTTQPQIQRAPERGRTGDVTRQQDQQVRPDVRARQQQVAPRVEQPRQRESAPRVAQPRTERRSFDAPARSAAPRTESSPRSSGSGRGGSSRESRRR
jgi:hypothetical protein